MMAGLSSVTSVVFFIWVGCLVVVHSVEVKVAPAAADGAQPDTTLTTEIKCTVFRNRLAEFLNANDTRTISNHRMKLALLTITEFILPPECKTSGKVLRKQYSNRNDYQDTPRVVYRAKRAFPFGPYGQLQSPFGLFGNGMDPYFMGMGNGNGMGTPVKDAGDHPPIGMGGVGASMKDPGDHPMPAQGASWPMSLFQNGGFPSWSNGQLLGMGSPMGMGNPMGMGSPMGVGSPMGYQGGMYPMLYRAGNGYSNGMSRWRKKRATSDKKYEMVKYGDMQMPADTFHKLINPELDHGYGGYPSPFMHGGFPPFGFMPMPYPMPMYGNGFSGGYGNGFSDGFHS